MSSRDALSRDTGDPGLRRTATRAALFVGVPLSVALGVQAISAQVLPKTWSAGETLTAADLNANFAAVAAAEPNGWFECGTLENLRDGAVKCQIAEFPADDYEYGFKYNAPDPHLANCLVWNRGLRFVNRLPYMVDSDNPTGGTMSLGGAMFYTETDAPDDDIPSQCGADTWRHRYWKIVDGNVVAHASNGCTNQKLFCRKRT